MKDTLKHWSLTVVVIFLAFSFGSWDINPGHWEGEVRAACAGLMLISLVPIAAYNSMVK
jgi:hypothetical protein